MRPSCLERIDKLLKLRRQWRHPQASSPQGRREALGFIRQFDQRLEADSRDPVPQRRGHQHTDNREADESDQQLVLGLVERFGVDADHEPQRRALILGRQLGQQHFQRIRMFRQLQIMHAGRALGEGADLRVRLTILVTGISADHPETNALVFLAEQLELGVDLHPMLGCAVTIERRFEHAVTRIQLGFREQAKALVDLLIQRAADQQKHQQRHQGEHPA